jgi:beta-galactosidase
MIAFGGDYNPEQWPEQTWAEDMALMKEAGVTMATVGVFSWAQVQHGPGQWDFGWLDRLMDLLADSGLGVDLATMTASPPPWLTRMHPEILPVRQDGTVLSPGGRQHFSPSSAVYKWHAAELVETLATRYAGHPALRMWHVGNEFGCHVAESYDDESAAAFRDWLRQRYHDIATLNDAWSTAFWSQKYTDFEEILPPRVAASYRNPAQQLDFSRFSDDAMLACYQAEAAILRRITPVVKITTNFLSLLRPVDMYKWSRHTDVAAVDCYPDPADPDAHMRAGLTYDIVRSARGGQPWILMEHPTSAVNWRAVNEPQHPGQLQVTSLQAVAHGADAVMYFQWRASRGGAEKFHSAMVPHAGPDSRVFREVTALGARLAGVPGLAGTRIVNKVALLFDWESWWASSLDSRPSSLTDEAETLLAWYTPLFSAGFGVDVVHPDTDLSGYEVVVVPSLYLLRGATGSRLADWTSAGGSLVVSYLTGIVDECDRIWLGGYLGPLGPVVGAVVEEHAPLLAGESVALSSGGTGSLWSERVVLRGASVVDTFAAGDLAGAPAVTRHEYGAGTAWYVATQPDLTTLSHLLGTVLSSASVRPVLPDLPPGVQAARRGDYLLLLNHRAEPRSVTLPAPMRSESGEPVTAVPLPPFGVAILRD